MKLHNVFTAVGLLLLCACKKEVAAPELKNEPQVELSSENCYQLVQGKDTISMRLTIKGDQLQLGKLTYNFFEKDDNEGTLDGSFRGDTLVGTYSFQSEGIISVREVIFVKQGNAYIEGFGPVVEQNGEVNFEDIKKVTFTTSPLVSVPCID